MERNPILTAKLSLSSDIPLYTQLVGIIKRHISSGALAVGELLPSEAELCRALDISRTTVRQAIGELEEEGLVVRKRGKGTFVADPSTNRRGVRYSFTTEVSSMGKSPSSTLVDFDVLVPPAEICRKMEQETREKCDRMLEQAKQMAKIYWDEYAEKCSRYMKAMETAQRAEEISACAEAEVL